jgi:hypothetical protein
LLPCFGILPRGGQAVSRGPGIRVVRAQHPFTGGQGELEQQDRFGVPASLLVGGGQVVLRGQGVGISRAEDPLPGDQDILELRDRIRDSPRGLVGSGQAVPRVERVGMVRAERPLKLRDRLQSPPDRRLARGITRDYLVTGHWPASRIGLDKVTGTTTVTQRSHIPTYRSSSG